MAKADADSTVVASVEFKEDEIEDMEQDDG